MFKRLLIIALLTLGLAIAPYSEARAGASFGVTGCKAGQAHVVRWLALGTSYVFVNGYGTVTYRTPAPAWRERWTWPTYHVSWTVWGDGHPQGMAYSFCVSGAR